MADNVAVGCYLANVTVSLARPRLAERAEADPCDAEAQALSRAVGAADACEADTKESRGPRS